MLINPRRACAQQGLLSMQPVKELGSIDKSLTFDVGLIHNSVSYQSVYLINTCNISVKLRRGFVL